MERIRNVTTAGRGEFLRVSTGIDPGEQCEPGHWRAEANWLQAGIRGRGVADGIQHVANCGDSLGWRPRAEDLRARSEVSALGRADRPDRASSRAPAFTDGTGLLQLYWSSASDSLLTRSESLGTFAVLAPDFRQSAQSPNLVRSAVVCHHSQQEALIGWPRLPELDAWVIPCLAPRYVPCS